MRFGGFAAMGGRYPTLEALKGDVMCHTSCQIGTLIVEDEVVVAEDIRIDRQDFGYHVVVIIAPCTGLDEAFLAAFRSKGRLTHMLEPISVHVIVYPDPWRLGAVHRELELLKCRAAPGAEGGDDV
jgi:hypothetical protein